jgi:hypothetical protein
VTWTNPGSITQGTALSGLQLDATASVPGSFAYTPGPGAVLPAGTNLLAAVFTPDDTLDYLGTTNTVQLVVAAAAADEDDSPLFPGGGGLVLLAGMAALGAAFLRWRAAGGDASRPPA